MARWQRHLAQFARIPGRNDQSAAVRIGSNHVHDLSNLVDRFPVDSPPVSPLSAIDASQIPLFVRPLVPDGHVIVGKESDVGVSA